MKKDKILYLAKVIAKGLVLMIWGTMTAGIIALAVYGFILVANESGYTAVGLFLCAMCGTALAIASVYAQGKGSLIEDHGKKGAK